MPNPVQCNGLQIHFRINQQRPYQYEYNSAVQMEVHPTDTNLRRLLRYKTSFLFDSSLPEG